nr:probable xyloglucan endotransglucosylase/hydrolase protein 33 [Tanacetum cinerariifolium]
MQRSNSSTGVGCLKNASVSSLDPVDGQEYEKLSKQQMDGLNWIITQFGRAALFEKYGRLLKTDYIPATVRDTSEALVHLFTVLNPATGLPDEVFTTCVIKRYHGVQGTSVLKRHPEEIGESSETMVTTSVLYVLQYALNYWWRVGSVWAVSDASRLHTGSN